MLISIICFILGRHGILLRLWLQHRVRRVPPLISLLLLGLLLGLLLLLLLLRRNHPSDPLRRSTTSKPNVRQPFLCPDLHP